MRLKTRAILVYFSIVCFGSVFFGLYFIFTPAYETKQKKGIDFAAKDKWSHLLHKQPSVLDAKHYNELRRPDLALGWAEKGNADRSNIWEDKKIGSENAEIVLPEKDMLYTMSWEEIAFLYHKYTKQIQINCQDIVRLGRVTDGGWEVCDDSSYRPSAPCLVYSFGTVGDDFSFDDAVARRYKCEVHSFDPSMNVKDYQRDSTVYFHQLGLADFTGETSDGWKMSTFADIRKHFHHEGKPLSILKLDIEEWEWKVLPSLLKSGYLNDTSQLLMELHQCEGCSRYNPAQVDKEATQERYILALQILKDLYDLGFRIFWEHQNLACSYISKFALAERSGCCELHMVQSRLLGKKKV
ncbi:hypothetical protein C0Q70_03045 [Pomacea canaliculata]|uniref:Methyltransferase domain-containing protein n=1 Tax=Pomacea canaliculata TaxID=400727 RepID=A0A2T7PRN4_POMCA|nr:hypothetical protein C0Q70_03045 [Pomacea canaliculata]